MVERFEPIPDGSIVFRFAPLPNPAGVFPPGAVLPAPDWFNPSKEDRDEAVARSRVPGWSCWNRDLTSLAQARILTERSENKCFGLKASKARAVGEQSGIPIEVVADPVESKAPIAGWQGHSLIEGLARPEGGSKAAYKELWRALRDLATPVLE